MSTSNNRNNTDLPPNTTRHTLPPESELRLEVPFGITCTVTLRSGSADATAAPNQATITNPPANNEIINGTAELFGAELPPSRPLYFTGTKLAIFTWHGCTLDVTNEDHLDILYVSEETDCNVAYVNTHAQLEVMRDESLGCLVGNPQQGGVGSGGHNSTSNINNNKETKEGPRVLLVGPPDCGKSSLAKVLTAYAVKLGRTPLLVDLDASQNMLSVPGTLAACPMGAEWVRAEGFGTCSVMNGGNAVGGANVNANNAGVMTPLVLWYGSMDLTAHPDLYKAQLHKLGTVIEGRLANDVDARASGIIVNSSGLIEDVGYSYILEAIQAFKINVVLVLGHDRLYSMLGTLFKKQAKEEEERKKKMEEEVPQTTPQSSSSSPPISIPKLIKLPRSGGVVSRDPTFRRASRSQSIKRYFYGDIIPPKSSDVTNAITNLGASSISPTTTATSPLQYQFTPNLIETPFHSLHLHKLTSLSLTASLLPVSAKQSTDPIQITTLPSSEITSKFQHSVWAVCHPSAVEKFERVDATSNGKKARELFLAGVAGFVVVEKVDVEREMVSLLSPCGGNLPSGHMLVGDVAWME
ncbi:hypothetical protein ACHAXS_008958 [Conticribra weissflogii]